MQCHSHQGKLVKTFVVRRYIVKQKSTKMSKDLPTVIRTMVVTTISAITFGTAMFNKKLTVFSVFKRTSLNTSIHLLVSILNEPTLCDTLFACDLPC